jgi:hypothetical protein
MIKYFFLTASTLVTGTDPTGANIPAVISSIILLTSASASDSIPI